MEERERGRGRWEWERERERERGGRETETERERDREGGEEREREYEILATESSSLHSLSMSIFASIFFGFISSSCFLIWTVSPATTQPRPPANCDREESEF